MDYLNEFEENAKEPIGFDFYVFKLMILPAVILSCSLEWIFGKKYENDFFICCLLMELLTVIFLLVKGLIN